MENEHAKGLTKQVERNIYHNDCDVFQVHNFFKWNDETHCTFKNQFSLGKFTKTALIYMAP